MKFLFIVQGEGRGHLTQAITLEEILRRNGHEEIGGELSSFSCVARFRPIDESLEQGQISLRRWVAPDLRG